MPPTNDTKVSRMDKILAFSFGIIFIAILLIVAVLIPEPSATSYTVFRIVLALAAAGVGAVLPGFISINVGGWLRAGGAIALFVIVYFFAPAPVSPIEKKIEPPP